jgi:predicted transcriptional regulator
MRKLEIGVGDVKKAAAEFLKTARALEKGATVRAREQLFFADMPTLLKTLTSERWRLVEHLRRDGPLSINAAAQQLGRNYKNVHGDVKRLMDIGLVERLDDGRVRVPFSSIIAELKMAA